MSQADLPDNYEDISGTNVVDMESYIKISPEKKIDLVETELLDALAYINTQINDAETKSEQIKKFSKSVIEGKKMLIEQKLNLLKQLITIPETRIKVDKLSDSEDDGDIADITSLFK